MLHHIGWIDGMTAWGLLASVGANPATLPDPMFAAISHGHEVSGCDGVGPARHLGSVAVMRKIPPQQGQTEGSKRGSGLVISPVAAIGASVVAVNSCRMIVSRARRQPLARKP